MAKPYLSYLDLERINLAYARSAEIHGHLESLRAALHEVGFVLEGDILPDGTVLHADPGSSEYSRGDPRLQAGKETGVFR